MNLAMAIEHGKRVGVRFYVMNDKNCIMGGTQTREQAEDMILRAGKPSAGHSKGTHMSFTHLPKSAQSKHPREP